MKLHEVANTTQVKGHDGKPLVVFHGSDQDFQQFDMDKQGEGASDGILQYGHGIYFTNNLEQAQGYGKFVKKAYLNISNPLRMDQDIPDHVKQYALDRYTNLRNQDDYMIDRAIGTVHRFLQFMMKAGHNTMTVLQELGYDGVIELHPYANVYVVFDVNQIELVS